MNIIEHRNSFQIFAGRSHGDTRECLAHTPISLPIFNPLILQANFYLGSPRLVCGSELSAGFSIYQIFWCSFWLPNINAQNGAKELPSFQLLHIHEIKWVSPSGLFPFFLKGFPKQSWKLGREEAGKSSKQNSLLFLLALVFLLIFPP